LFNVAEVPDLASFDPATQISSGVIERSFMAENGRPDDMTNCEAIRRSPQ
jgi:hypothetical protein